MTRYITKHMSRTGRTSAQGFDTKHTNIHTKKTKGQYSCSTILNKLAGFVWVMENLESHGIYYRVISNLEVFRCEIINTAEQKDGLTSFLMLNVLEAKIFQYDCLEGHNV